MPTLGPRYGDQVPHPLNRQDIPKTTPFRRQKRRFLFRAVPGEARSTFKAPAQMLHILRFVVGQRLFT